jgi:enamine deaminase RidA (YjgF/YER057c/UK114 family)
MISERSDKMSKITRLGVGKRMSSAVIHGDTVYLSGLVAETARGRTVTEQTREILASIDAILAEAGTDKSRLLQATIWLADIADFAEMNKIWDAWVTPGETPVRACVEARLAAPDYMVEIRVIAAR